MLGIFYLPAGIQAAFFPQSFYDDFPMGRSWIAVDGAYNEHLVRDVGALFLALAIASFFAWWHPSLVRALAVAWLVFGVLHLVYHAEHLEHFDGADKVGLLGSLVVVPALAIYALVAAQPAATYAAASDFTISVRLPSAMLPS